MVVVMPLLSASIILCTAVALLGEGANQTAACTVHWLMGGENSGYDLKVLCCSFIVQSADCRQGGDMAAFNSVLTPTGKLLVVLSGWGVWMDRTIHCLVDICALKCFSGFPLYCQYKVFSLLCVYCACIHNTVQLQQRYQGALPATCYRSKKGRAFIITSWANLNVLMRKDAVSVSL